MPLPNTDTQLDVADESAANRTPCAASHRPPHLQLTRTNSFPTSSGPLSTPGPTCNTDQTYRILPIIAGILIPLSVLLSIPSLTSRWHVQTDGNVELDARPSPLHHIVAMSLGMACGVLANICLVLRFAERNIQKMTLLCIVLLSMNELINITALVVFAMTHRFTEGFIYGQSFWMTVCSMVISVSTNFTLIIDYCHTKNFTKSGSGLTHKQRSLVIIIIVLLCYITFGSLVQTFMLEITFIDSLYFTVVSIESIGFGDIRPSTTGSRIFVSLYVSGGILNIALAVALLREVLLEGVTAGFRERVKKLRSQQRNRRIRERWKAAVKWRLQSKNLPIWIVDGRLDEPRHDSRHYLNHWWTSVKQVCCRRRKKLSRMEEGLPSHAANDKHLNLNALTQAQLEAAALEAGAPLAEILPSRLETPVDDAGNVDTQPQPLLTHMQIGGMVSLLGQFAVSFVHSHVNEDPQIATNHDDNKDSIDERPGPVRGRLGVPFTRTLTNQDEESFLETLKSEERSAFIARLSLAWLLFIIFWVAGAVIFMMTEGWAFGTSIYFCFIAFSTVGYGDYAPQTETGRSIFVVWSLLGVAAMTILISILTEAYSKTYKSAIRAEMIKATSSTEDGSTAFTRQRSVDSRAESRTNTMVNTSDFPPYLPQSSVSSHLGKVTFLSSSRNDDPTCKISEPLTQVKCEAAKQSSGGGENMTALSLDILRHTEMLRSLLNSIEDNEILEIEAYNNQVERTIRDIVAVAKDSLGLVESMV